MLYQGQELAKEETKFLIELEKKLGKSIIVYFIPPCFLKAPEKPYKKNKYTYFESYFKN